ncbi:MAG: Eco57I restriction-modification methylase domain-containing protein [Lutibacter sp.]
MPNFNLVAEKKNQSNSQKADGAILKNKLAVAVIELKGTKTKDLESIRKQAFDYKANQKECVYVITSNYEKLRFYINDATEFEEFNLFTLTDKEFELLYLCLNKENILGNIPLKIKEESVTEEEKITKSFYADYSLFKRELYRDLVKQNGKELKLIRHSELVSEEKELQQFEKNVKLTLFKKSQKLIDRFLFIFFAEDRDLLPPNSTIQILDKWKSDMEFGDERPLYNLFKQYFNYLDSGRKQMGKRAEIYAYNGGLFKPDVVLDSVKINDELLYKHSKALAKYDFESQVDVNILGHIFENSLNEIESVNAEIEGSDFDKQKSKRKKDGVFYTPKYITKYIVENTIGKLCIEKKEELGFKEEEYYKSRKGRQQVTLENLIAILDSYRAWLLKLTICDPACGSGAFLNQALDFLIKEHRYIDELKAQLLGGGLVFSDIENTILENNIYGVDLNEESVEIAKLSLWLRTAQPKRKLNDLNSNIKCGNSLIDSKAVAGDKAFNWQQEFPHIFSKGGFDVVIGNPPYVNLERMKEVSLAIEKMGYETYNKRGDLYILFVEKGFNLIKEKGIISYIMPNKWLQAGYGKNLREYFLTKELIKLIDFGDLQIFEGATTYPCIFIAKNNKPKANFSVSVLKSTNSFDFDTIVTSSAETFETTQFSGDTWVISSNKDIELLERLKNNFKSLSETINGQVNYGIKTGLSEAFFIDREKRDSLIKKDKTADSILFPFVKGRDLNKWQKPTVDNYLIGTFPSLNLDIDNFTSIKEHLLSFGKEKLEQNGLKGSRKKTNNNWFETQDTISYWKEFSKPKIMYQVFQVKPCFIFDEQNLYCNNSMWIIPTDNKALLGVLNSKMGWWLITKYCTQIQNGCQLIWKYFGQIPIPKLSNSNLTISVENIISSNEKLQEISQKFQRSLERKFELETLPKKLQDWYLLSYAEFIKELAKKKIKLSLSQEAEWEDYFLLESKKALALKTDIDTTDKEIDALVYELYGLSEEEIGIVEYH